MSTVSPVGVVRAAISSGSALLAAMDAVTALIEAGLLAADKERTAGPLALQEIRQARVGADTHSRINPATAARAVVAVLEQHNLLTQPPNGEAA